jgi:cold shock CspA family protein
MARSSQSFNKREKEKQKAKERQEKRERAEERKANAKKGRPLEDMMAYIDENGNISSSPPDPSKMKTFNAEDIVIGVPQYQEEEDEAGPRTGTVAFFNTTKGFGFIKDSRSGESIFVHISKLTEPVQEGEKVRFQTEMGAKGPVAINIQKDK